MPKFKVHAGDSMDTSISPYVEIIEAESFTTDREGNLIFTSTAPGKGSSSPSHIFSKDYWYKAYRMDDLRKL